jgi:undecaprenyl-diphosphatase
MNGFDYSIISFLNGFARESLFFDLSLSFLSTNNLFKGGILITILWWFWFKDNNPGQLQKNHIVVTLCSCLIALFSARVLAVLLPFRLRPIHNYEYRFHLPYGINPSALDSWSSFPSDHAVLFFALAAGMFLLSRKLGVFVLIYVLTIICFPRVYMGLHYPTDILAGAFIGVGITSGVSSTSVRRLLLPPVHDCMNKSPGTFYACFFFLSYQIACMFDPVRAIGQFISMLLKIY